MIKEEIDYYIDESDNTNHRLLLTLSLNLKDDNLTNLLKIRQLPNPKKSIEENQNINMNQAHKFIKFIEFNDTDLVSRDYIIEKYIKKFGQFDEYDINKFDVILDNFWTKEEINYYIDECNYTNDNLNRLLLKLSKNKKDDNLTYLLKIRKLPIPEKSNEENQNIEQIPIPEKSNEENQNMNFISNSFINPLKLINENNVKKTQNLPIDKQRVNSINTKVNHFDNNAEFYKDYPIIIIDDWSKFNPSDFDINLYHEKWKNFNKSLTFFRTN